MKRRPASPLPPPGAVWLALACLFVPLVADADVFNPEPRAAAPTVDVGGKAYTLLDTGPVTYRLVGRGRLYGFARIGLDAGQDEASAALVIEGLHGRTLRLPLEFERSKKSSWGDGHPTGVSKGRKFEVFVPAGEWMVTLQAEAPAGTRMAAVFYYDGPSQDTEVLKPSPWKFSNKLTLEHIYDDNVFTLHPDAIGAFIAGPSSGLPRMKTHDDYIFAPTLDLSATRQFWDLGKTKFRFKIKRWMYAQNPIKTNTDFDFYVRQSFPGRKSLELYLHHAPIQYIRQLGDRSPYGGVSSSKEFRFARNIINLTWRHSLSRTLSYKLILESNLRYYNKPFQENDVEAWEIRGSVAYRMFKRRLTVTADYSFEDAAGRGYDSVDESHDDSDDSDPGYHRDLYRLGLDLKTPWLRPVADKVGVAYLFMDYYYTTTKDLFDSPYQVGRRDKWAKGFIKAGKRLRKGIDLNFTFTYSERQVESPWYGDITLDKDYISRRYSLALSYAF